MDEKSDKVNEKLLSLEKDLAKLSSKLQEKNRALEIERALDEVRVKTMAMQHSDELKKVIQVVHDQLVNLGIYTEHAGFILNYKENDAMHIWLADKNVITNEILIPYFDSPHWNSFNDSKIQGKSFFANQFSFEEKNKFYTDLFKVVPELPEDLLDKYLAYKGLSISTVLLDNIGLYIENFEGKPYSQEENNILMRFGRVFQQTYTRFLDLQKAEAQAREAQIEAALERLRAASMAMHHSEELSSTSFVMFQEIVKLGIRPWNFAFFIFHGQSDIADCFSSDQTGSYPTMVLPHKPDQFLRKTYEDWRANKKLTVQEAKGRALKKHQEYMKTIPGFDQIIKQRRTAGIKTLKKMIFNNAHFKYGYIMINTLEPQTDFWDILQRIAKVFEQTYTRFLDLKKAEAQAREAQIVSALERIRSSSLAMHKTDNLGEVVQVLFDEMQGLSVEMGIGSVSIYIFSEGTRDMAQWLALPDGVQLLNVPYFEHPILAELHKAKDRGDRFFAKIFPVELKNSWTEKGFKLTDYKNLPDTVKAAIKAAPGYSLTMTIAKNSGIAIPNFAGKLLAEDDNEILKRVGRVFEQSYIRFLDIQKAELQAREAQIEAALERLRAASMAMHHSEELTSTSLVMFQEIVKLGIRPWNFAFFIFHGQSDIADCFASDQTGSLPTMVLPHKPDQFLRKTYEDWRAKKSLTVQEAKGRALKKHQEYMKTIPGFDQIIKQRNTAGVKTLKKMIFNNAHFKYGYIMINTLEPYTDFWDILQRIAKVFEQTYTRFLDLKKAEVQAAIAKKQSEEIELAYENLKATQTQLIQSEKMASLGELTAGIAHEIQNPLNFVNNFSAVSAELVAEAKEELENGELDEAKEILDDLITNLQKITHHGGRASSIVKGMLAHSRSGKGEKVPTDINALCDEYLRLAYHGLRAKDSYFNVKLETDFDDSIGEINVIPQDIGRVLLNLITNAFQAIDKDGIVKVSSKKKDGFVNISVSDNGPGIPDDIKDKIFQPFFTTKPTGSGTGLGLSLAYDIVKAHGGKLSVETEVGEGSTFIIQLLN